MTLVFSRARFIYQVLLPGCVTLDRLLNLSGLLFIGKRGQEQHVLHRAFVRQEKKTHVKTSQLATVPVMIAVSFTVILVIAAIVTVVTIRCQEADPGSRGQDP